jgi:hypothetical protein
VENLSAYDKLAVMSIELDRAHRWITVLVLACGGLISIIGWMAS